MFICRRNIAKYKHSMLQLFVECNLFVVCFQFFPSCYRRVSRSADFYHDLQKRERSNSYLVRSQTNLTTMIFNSEFFRLLHWLSNQCQKVSLIIWKRSIHTIPSNNNRYAIHAFFCSFDRKKKKTKKNRLHIELYLKSHDYFRIDQQFCFGSDYLCVLCMKSLLTRLLIEQFL